RLLFRSSRRSFRQPSLALLFPARIWRLSPSPLRSGGEGRGEEAPFRSARNKPLSPCPLPAALRSWSLPTSRPAGHRGFLPPISHIQIRSLQIRNPNQIPNP